MKGQFISEIVYKTILDEAELLCEKKIIDSLEVKNIEMFCENYFLNEKSREATMVFLGLFLKKYPIFEERLLKINLRKN